ncbi:hypothetical protein KEM55_005121, partial [Ascosphaera atra]
MHPPPSQGILPLELRRRRPLHLRPARARRPQREPRALQKLHRPNDLFQVQQGFQGNATYHELLGFLPAAFDPEKAVFRITNAMITSQVAGMVVNGMFEEGRDVSLLVQVRLSIIPGFPLFSLLIS